MVKRGGTDESSFKSAVDELAAIRFAALVKLQEIYTVAVNSLKRKQQPG